MPTQKWFTVKTETGGRFPHDMLRYDTAWPRTSDDATKMGGGRDGRVEAGTEITLSSNAPGAPSKGRWKSFGWDVTAEGRR
jgi:hypothetical protein